MIEPQYRTLTASDGYRLHVTSWSTEGPPKGRFLILHGVQSHGGWYHHLGRTLAALGFEADFPDRRGSGSNADDRGHTPSDGRLVEDVREALRDLRDRSPHVPQALAGISWGDKLAVLAAARHPKLVDTLALICPGLHPRVDVSRGERLRIAWAYFTNRRKTFPIPLSDPALFTESPAGRAFIASDPLGLREATAGLLAASRFIDLAVARAPSRVRQPILLMLAGRDRIVDNAKTRAYFDRLASADRRLIEYPEGHHTLEFEADPSRYAVDLAAWFTNVNASSSRDNTGAALTGLFGAWGSSTGRPRLIIDLPDPSRDGPSRNPDRPASRNDAPTRDAEPAAPAPPASSADGTGFVRRWLRSRRSWRAFQEARREGWDNVRRRRHYQSKILGSPPIRTARSGPVEVRALTWDRDWKNLLWALKSFYHFARVDYPLFIHDGGLRPGQAEKLRRHFPDATFVGLDEADGRIRGHLSGRPRSLEYRLQNPSTRKLFDFFAFSKADYLLSIDSDIVFFGRPDLLLVPPEGLDRNRYNRDIGFWYSMTVDELREAFGIAPPERINSGLSVIKRDSIDFDAIEDWLGHPKMFADKWVTEQTLHALCSTVHGVEFLPETYLVANEAGLDPSLVCKHYPGFFRKYLYTEGMARLLRDAASCRPPPRGRRADLPLTDGRAPMSSAYQPTEIRGRRPVDVKELPGPDRPGRGPSNSPITSRPTATSRRSRPRSPRRRRPAAGSAARPRPTSSSPPAPSPSASSVTTAATASSPSAPRWPTSTPRPIRTTNCRCSPSAARSSNSSITPKSPSSTSASPPPSSSVSPARSGASSGLAPSPASPTASPSLARS